MIRIAIAEDHQSFIDGLHLLLDQDDTIRIIASVNNGEDLLQVLETKTINVVLTDIKMPKIDGIAACRLIKKSYPHVKVIALSMFDQDDAIRQMMDAGCNGYLLKNSSLDLVLKAIQSVHKGEDFFDSSISIEGLQTSSLKKQILTASESDILKLISQVKTSREIAEILFTAVSTV